MATLPHYSNCIKVLMFGYIKPDDLRQHFLQFGEVSRISQPYFSPFQTTLNHGTYVTFKTNAAASAACRDRSQNVVEGFRTKRGIKVFRSRQSEPIDSTQISVQTSLITPEPKTVKVSMMNGQLNKEDVRLLFRPCGEITSLHVVTNGDPPHAYINFSDPEAAKRASINFHKKSCKGVSLLTRLMPPKDSQATTVARPISSTQIPVQISLIAPKPKTAVARPITSTHFPVQIPKPKTVKVSMMNGQLNKEELRLLFRPYGEITSLHVVTDGNRPHAYINFSDPDAAKRASIEVHKQSCKRVSLLTRLMPPKESQATRMARPTLARQTLCSANCVQYPPMWSSTSSIVKVKVKRSSKEWNDISILFYATMAQAALISIDRIENKNIYDEYAHRMQKMQEKGKPLNEKKLFHGSLKTPPVKIYESDEGFDFRFSVGGLWGKGAYFAVKASFSNHYSYRDQKGHKQIFLASVLTGETCLMDKEDKSLTMPPLKPGSHKRYDSVSAHHSGGSDIFVVYKLDMAYPTHLITYTSVV